MKKEFINHVRVRSTLDLFDTMERYFSIGYKVSEYFDDRIVLILEPLKVIIYIDNLEDYEC